MNLLYLLELIGTGAFAASGALAASRKNMDIFGFGVLALMPAIGGGTLRDVVLGRQPVFWIDDSSYVVIALAVAVAVFFPRYRAGARRRLLAWADALGMALFATMGTEIALQSGTDPLVAAILGVATAVAGGMIRDIICNEIPMVLTREIYATAAFAASTVFIVATSLGLSRNPALLAATTIGFAIRALSIRYKWTLPRARASR